jgi:hypothetical protein
MRRFMVFFFATMLAIACGGVASASAKELQVSNNAVECPQAHYDTIQKGVDAAGPGDTVAVCPGTYSEQVNVPKGKDGLVLESTKPQQATIQFPMQTKASNALVRVNGAKGVTVRDFTITGPYYDTGCSPQPHSGLRVDGGGQAAVYGNHITKIQDAISLFAGCQDGIAVQVGRKAEQQTGSAAIVRNTIDGYQKNGPTIDNAGSNAMVAANQINGGGPTQTIARNGIQISRGAKAGVFANSVYGNSYQGMGSSQPGDANDSVDSTGMLLYQAGSGVRIGDNSVFKNDLGIDAADSEASWVANNMTHDNLFDGIRSESDAKNNVFAGNRSNNDGRHDCHDASTGNGTAGTANRWDNDQGKTSDPSGICHPGARR